MEPKKGFLKSLVTDKEWDGDPTKVAGWVLVTCGVIGWFAGKDPTIIFAFGGGLLGLGKFSQQG